jgi:hypothetical protein
MRFPTVRSITVFVARGTSLAMLIQAVPVREKLVAVVAVELHLADLYMCREFI